MATRPDNLYGMTHVLASPWRRTAVVAAAAVALLAVGAPLSTASAESSEIDINFAPILFDYTNHTNINPVDPDCSLADTDAYCVGKDAGDIVRFNDVVSAGGRSVDAVIETSLSDAVIGRYEVSSSSSWQENPLWFWTRLGIFEDGGYASFTMTFYESGTYTGPGTGTPVTLRNVRLTVDDVNDAQFAQFSEVDGYTLGSPTELTYDPSLRRFTSTDTDDTEEFPERYRVLLTYDTLGSLTFSFGADLAGGANFALVGEALPFSGPVVERGPLAAESPAPIAGPAPVPEIGFTTSPAPSPEDWQTLPTCGVYLPGGTEPLAGTLEPGTYLTRCTGGASEVFEPAEYVDGELVVTAPPPGPDPTPVTPSFTG